MEIIKYIMLSIIWCVLMAYIIFIVTILNISKDEAQGLPFYWRLSFIISGTLVGGFWFIRFIS